MSNTASAVISGIPHDSRDRIVRRIACIMLAELPATVLDHPGTTLRDLIEHTAVSVCRAYGIDFRDIGPDLIDLALTHLGTYFPEPERHHPADSAEDDTEAARLPHSLLTRVSYMDQLEPVARAALLRRVHTDFDPAEDARGDIEHQIDQHERVLQTVRGGVWRGIKSFGVIDDASRLTGPDAWKTASPEELLDRITINIRANLAPVLSDVIVKETVAFLKRHDR